MHFFIIFVLIAIWGLSDHKIRSGYQNLGATMEIHGRTFRNTGANCYLSPCGRYLYARDVYSLDHFWTSSSIRITRSEFFGGI